MSYNKSEQSDDRSSSNVVLEHKDMFSPEIRVESTCEMDVSQTSNSSDDSPMEGNSIVHTKLPPGKVNFIQHLTLEIGAWK